MTSQVKHQVLVTIVDSRTFLAQPIIMPKMVAMHKLTILQTIRRTLMVRTMLLVRTTHIRLLKTTHKLQPIP